LKVVDNKVAFITGGRQWHRSGHGAGLSTHRDARHHRRCPAWDLPVNPGRAAFENVRRRLIDDIKTSSGKP
jgi:hypothetical protein